MNISPLVSIVIPVYNRKDYIQQAIFSAVNQTYKNIEIVICDNQSTDGTWEILEKAVEKDCRIKIFQNKENIGPVLNWYECFLHAHGEYLKIIWSDDWISLDFIEKALKVFTDDTAFVISGIQITEGNKEIAEILFKKREYTQKEYFDDIFLCGKENFPVSPGCALFRKEDVLNNFVVDIPNQDHLNSKKNGAGNDLLIFLGIALNYRVVKTLESVDSYFRAHAGSFTIADKLDLYYSWGMVFFLQNRLKNRFYLDIMKCKFLKRKLKSVKYVNIYKAIPYHPSLLFNLGRFFLKKI